MTLEMPVIDVSSPDKACADALVAAAATHGFVFIKRDGTGIPADKVDQMFALVSLKLGQSEKLICNLEQEVLFFAG